MIARAHGTGKCRKITHAGPFPHWLPELACLSVLNAPPFSRTHLTAYLELSTSSQFQARHRFGTPDVRHGSERVAHFIHVFNRGTEHQHTENKLVSQQPLSPPPEGKATKPREQIVSDRVALLTLFRAKNSGIVLVSYEEAPPQPGNQMRRASN